MEQKAQDQLEGSIFKYEQMCNEIDTLKQEIERLKKQVNFFKDTELAEMIDQLKEREEMIREAIPWITDSVFPNYKNADQRIWGKETEEIKNWLEKANKITKGKDDNI